ncbi:uncharacterized protein ASCRUDRAFT_27974, partial [Ascoidea rubescens DSM 1968]
MCIFLTTCAHPAFPFILISNRDEYFLRPTALAHFHSNKILSPYDLARNERGTWIGVNKAGKIAVLVNFHEDNYDSIYSKVSRGLIPMQFLKSPKKSKDWELELYDLYQNKENFVQKIGGFSLLFGELSYNKTANSINPLKIISNRGDEEKKQKNVKFNQNDNPIPINFSSENSENTLKQQYSNKKFIGLSNSLFNHPWPKVQIGENLLNNLITNSINENWQEQKIIQKLFELLSFNSFQIDKEFPSENFNNLKNSIFIPPFEVKDNKIPNIIGKYYGTRTQTIILLDKQGNLKYIERSLHTKDTLTEPSFDNVYSFNI